MAWRDLPCHQLNDLQQHLSQLQGDPYSSQEELSKGKDNRRCCQEDHELVVTHRWNGADPRRIFKPRAVAPTKFLNSR